MEATKESKQETPAYVSYSTFSNALTALRELKPLPTHIDASVFPTMSGSSRSQLMPALSFLGLVTNDGRPTEELKSLVGESDEIRQKVLKSILEKKYPGAVKALSAGTPMTLKRDFGYEPAEAVKKRCIRFFTAAAKECGLPISSLILNKSGVRKPKRTVGNKRPTIKKRVPAISEPAAPNGGVPAHTDTHGLKRFPIPVGTKSGLVLWSIGVPESGYIDEDVETFLAVVKTALLKKQ
ncbi:MAG: hypothetical protein WCU88_03430 [Elusimicrobiota bacterium]|jgi:hypothetical protein